MNFDHDVLRSPLNIKLIFELDMRDANSLKFVL